MHHEEKPHVHAYSVVISESLLEGEAEAETEAKGQRRRERT